MDLLWQWRLERERALNCSLREPAVQAGRVLVSAGFATDGVHAGALVSLSARSGRVHWEHITSGVPHKPTCDDKGTAFLGTFGGNVRAFDRDGGLLWSFDNPVPLGSPVATDAGHLVIAELSGNSAATLCLDNATGAVRWRYVNGGHSYPISSDGNFIVHSTAKRNESGVVLLCLRVDTGAWAWSARSQTCLFRPCIIDSTVFVGAIGGVQAHDLLSGQRIAFFASTRGTGVTQAIVARERHLCFCDEHGLVTAIRFEVRPSGHVTFEPLWSYNAGGPGAKPILRDGFAFFLGVSGTLVALDLETGAARATVQLRPSQALGGVATDGTMLYVASGNELSAFQMP